MKKIAPLSDVQVRQAKAPDKPIFLFDGGGLYLEVLPKATKRWRLKYQHNRQKRLMTLGTYPDVSLTAARKKRDEIRAGLAAGIAPVEKQAADDRVQQGGSDDVSSCHTRVVRSNFTDAGTDAFEKSLGPIQERYLSGDR
ncbi:MAG: Arm DNA-binding domain-containing protein [Candidatus Ozemobacteraceae bacterium]